MTGRSARLVRAGLAVCFALLLAAGFRRGAALLQAANQPDPRYFREVLAFARELAARTDGIFAEADQRQLQDTVLRLQFSLNHWTHYADAPRDCAVAAAQVFRILERSPQLERVWIGARARPEAIVRLWPLGSGIVLLRIGRSQAKEAGPRVVRSEYDLARENSVDVDVGSAEIMYAALLFQHAPSGEKRVAIRLRSEGKEAGSAELAVTTPPTGTLRISILDAGTGQPTPAAAAVYASNDEIVVPEEALAFDQGGFVYQPGRVRPHGQSHFWPGGPQRQRAFFVTGRFSVRVPEGSYQILAAKGPEYLPVTLTVPVKANGETSREIALRRWTNMPARGWYSGDGHVHYARADADANRRLIAWTQAEDIHMANVLRMGDAKETYFEQYGFGKEARYAAGDYALAPGQEDPRTNVIGHTMQLNIQQPVRFPDRYYLYGKVFDEVHRQGGLTGYAHIYQPTGSAFHVRRDMTLNVPAGRVDFAEICEFGDIGDDLYYEFLNLGFPLTASAGSDVPWGNTVGTSRVYAYTGERFSPDAWFAAVKAGHTFVTTGPMLEFTVNGKIAGSEIEAKAGDVLHIKAAATGEAVPPRYLEIVAQGEVVTSTKAPRVEFDLPVRDSTWIAARCYGAHTTPVYVKVGRRSFARRELLPALVARRLETLKELEDAMARDLPAMGQGNWDNPAAWRENAAALREQIKAAREIYRQLR